MREEIVCTKMYVTIIHDEDGATVFGYGDTPEQSRANADKALDTRQAQRQAWLLTFCRTASEIERDDEKQSHLDPRHGHWGGL